MIRLTRGQLRHIISEEIVKSQKQTVTITRSMLRSLIAEAISTGTGGQFTLEEAGAACEAYAKKFGYEYRPINDMKGGRPQAAGVVSKHSWIINIWEDKRTGGVTIEAHTEQGDRINVTPADLYDFVEKNIDVAHDKFHNMPDDEFYGPGYSKDPEGWIKKYWDNMTKMPADDPSEKNAKELIRRQKASQEPDVLSVLSKNKKASKPN